MAARIVEHTSAAELLAASWSNMVAFYSYLGHASGTTFRATPRVVWLYTGVQVPILNGVLSVNLEVDEVKPIFDELQTRIDEQGAPAVWNIGPQSRPDNIGTLLKQYGVQQSWEMPAMAVDLATVGEEQQTTAGLVIRKVETAEMRRQWSRTLCAGNGASDAVADAIERLHLALPDLPDLAFQRFTGLLNGTPVATSILVLDSGLAGIYAVATCPEARRRGIGKLMTVIPLLEARRAGYRVGVLQASDMGYPIYRAIGFTDIYRYRIYLQTRH